MRTYKAWNREAGARYSQVVLYKGHYRRERVTRDSIFDAF